MATRYSSLEAVFAAATQGELIWAQESPNGDYVWWICQYFDLERLWNGRAGYQVVIPNRRCRLFLNIDLPDDESVVRLHTCMIEYLGQHGATGNEDELSFWRVGATSVSMVWQCHFTNNVALATFMARFKQKYAAHDFAEHIDLRQYHDWQNFPVVDPCIERDIHAAYGPHLHVQPHPDDDRQIRWLHEPDIVNPSFKYDAIAPTDMLDTLTHGLTPAANTPIGSIVDCPKGASCARHQASVHLLKTGKVVACTQCSTNYYMKDDTVQKGFTALPNELTDRLEPEMLLTDSKITVIDAPMGHGKTTICKRFLQRHVPNNARILAPCFRKGLSSYLAATFNLNDYQFENFWSNPSYADRAVICLNSLYRLATDNYNTNYDIIIIDECVFTMIHLLSGTFYNRPSEADRFDEVMSVFCRLLRNASKIILMQHCVPEECISFYSLMATGQADGSQVRRIKVDAPMTMQPCDVYRGKYGYMALHMKMLQFYLEEGVPFVVVVTTAEHARAVRALFHKLIERRFPDQTERTRRFSRIKMVTGNYQGYDDADFTDDVWTKRFKTVPNDLQNLAECDVLIYNTALQAGLSVETGYFRTAFEFLQNGILTSRDEHQLTSRQRSIPWGKKYVWIQHSKDTVETKNYTIQKQARSLLFNTDNESMTPHVKQLLMIAWSVQVSELLHTRLYHFENYHREYVRANGHSFTEVNVPEKPPDQNGISIDWIKEALNSDHNTRTAAIQRVINPGNSNTAGANNHDVGPMSRAMSAHIKSMIHNPDDPDAYNVVAKTWNATKHHKGTTPERHFSHVRILHAYLDLVSNDNQAWQHRAQRSTNPSGQFEAIIMQKARLLQRMLEALGVDPFRQFDLTIDPRGLNQDNTILANRMQAMRQFFHIEGDQGLDEHGHPTFAVASHLLNHPNFFQTYLAQPQFNVTSKVQTALARCGIPCSLNVRGVYRKYRANRDKFILHLCALKAVAGPDNFAQYQPLFDQQLWNDVQQKYDELSYTQPDQSQADQPRPANHIPAAAAAAAAASPEPPSRSAPPYSWPASSPQTLAPLQTQQDRHSSQIPIDIDLEPSNPELD
ncbi:hypothetical protein TRICI_003515 [Trichomonascus ciferrii]|uniref:Replication origin-binding protein domain-containing protein n=1 Tax=Trichomonascus ciferrii TaxID=44093 RepID=A0A642V4W6_9ASCO|nr:hypothetical protein TRICI_003515 [Trichomonascus ciferrii]